jgi:hypothetical protein
MSAFTRVGAYLLGEHDWEVEFGQIDVQIQLVRFASFGLDYISKSLITVIDQRTA